MAMHASWISKQISKGVDDRLANGSAVDDRPANGSAEDEKMICSAQGEACESISCAAVNKKAVQNFESTGL